MINNIDRSFYQHTTSGDPAELQNFPSSFFFFLRMVDKNIVYFRENGIIQGNAFFCFANKGLYTHFASVSMLKCSKALQSSNSGFGKSQTPNLTAGHVRQQNHVVSFFKIQA